MSPEASPPEALQLCLAVLEHRLCKLSATKVEVLLPKATYGLMAPTGPASKPALPGGA